MCVRDILPQELDRSTLEVLGACWSLFLYLCLDNLPKLGRSGSRFEGIDNESSPSYRFDNLANRSGE